MKIILGLIALGIVVIVHEAGHFLAAKLCGVAVESFSVGWGPVLLRKKWRGTEYRLSLLPIGGYCGMKGETAWEKAIDENLDAIPEEEGGFYSCGSLRRIIIGFAGPFANLILAFILLAIVGMQDYSFYTWENRIIPVAEADESGELYPAAAAGLIAGDRILSINGVEMSNFYDIQQYVGTRADEALKVEFERDGQVLATEMTASLDKKTGLGKIGAYPFIPLKVGSIKEGSSAETAGLRAGDEIVAVNGRLVQNQLDFAAALAQRREQAALTVKRENVTLERTITVIYRENGEAETGIGWSPIAVSVAGARFPACILKGLEETARMVALTLKSLTLLFRGVDLTEAVSGPVRITVMLGEAASASAMGFLELVAIICVSLFLMNLLPIPILDGGVILVALIEGLSRRKIRPKTLYRMQLVGAAIIAVIFVFALFGDIRYLFKK